MNSAFGTFFYPGPTEVRSEVLAAMQRRMIPHRGREFEVLFARLQSGLQSLFRTARPVYVVTSSATGLMEGAVRCAPDGRILAIDHGAFSGRFGDIARACGRDVEVMKVAWGSVPQIDEIERRLNAQRFAAVTVVHSETSTGVTTDIRRIAELAHAAGAEILVDSVTGIGGIPLEFDEWQLDFALTGSQKALALPPGLAFAAADAEFVNRAREVGGRGRYFDVVEFEEYAHKNQTPNTPVLSLLYALDVQLESIAREGMEARWARHAEMARMTVEWTTTMQAEGIEVTLLPPEGSRAATVSVITLPRERKSSDLVAAVSRRGFVIGTGYGELRERTFRIGHMGDHTPGGLAQCLDACGSALREVMRRG